ncbi:unnamed protein product [Brugia pahangi]|uniref:DDE_Tnp_1_7 domain-containing protein n=1 Tax=Brugia pahangi TaxID=6280 RepID=A0A0N4TXH4_BRUPA|nr:unnamed protein product [Brugia pahangi]
MLEKNQKWRYEELFAFLKSSKAYIKGIFNPLEIADLISYLKVHSTLQATKKKKASIDSSYCNGDFIWESDQNRRSVPQADALPIELHQPKRCVSHT